jgi:PAS domain S-box-containing protein
MELWTRADLIPPVRLRASEAASEAAFALLDGLWSAPIGVAFFDRELRFLQVNEWMARANGVPVADHLGRTMSEVLGAHGEVVAHAVGRVELRIRSVFESGRPVLGLSIPGTLPDGTHREWQGSYYPVRSAAGDVRAVCAIVSDVTHERDREAFLERARGEAERGARRLAFLQDVTASLSAAYDPASVAEVIVQRVRPLLGARTATIRLLGDDGALHVLAWSGLGADLTRADAIRLDEDLPMPAALRREEAIWISGVDEIVARFPAIADRVRAAGQRAIVALPLVARGRRLGALGLAFDEPRAFDLEERAFVLAAAEQCAQALDRATLYESERDALRKARVATERVVRIQAFTAALSGARAVADVAEVAVAQAEAALGASAAVACTLDAAAGALRIEAARGATLAPPRGSTIPLDAPLPIARAAREGRAIWLESGEAILAAYPALGEIVPPERLGALVALPLRAGGRVLGAVAFVFEAGRRFGPALREIVATAAGQCAQAMERARLGDAERAAGAEAERARALLGGIVENAPVGIGFLDRSGRFQQVNHVLAAMDGLPAAAHLGRTPREALPGLPADEIEDAVRRAGAEGRPLVDVAIAGETPAAPGVPRHFLVSVYPVAAGGEPIGTRHLVRDVTADREAEAFRKHVFGIVGHDLRNPLSAIVTAGTLLARGEDVTPRQARLLARIESSARRMDEIIHVLLDYAKVRAGHGVPLQRKRVDLAAIARAVADECEAAHAGREVRTTGDELFAEVDPDRVAQVLSNLVTNALAYSPRESPVELAWSARDDGVVLHVANVGPPIPEDLVPRLFEPFRRGAEERRGAGLGLGLFIARAIVDAHGGAIEVRSVPGRTVFEVALPRA